MESMDIYVKERLSKVTEAALESYHEVIDEESQKCFQNVSDGIPVGTRFDSTHGGLKRSLKIEKINEPGTYGYNIYFEGTNEEGLEYKTIAGWLNKGTSKIEPRRFIDKAVRKLKGMDTRIAERFLDKIDKLGGD
jgi:hypothetical protein